MGQYPQALDPLMWLLAPLGHRGGCSRPEQRQGLWQVELRSCSDQQHWCAVSVLNSVTLSAGAAH